ncbi:MAG: hypothetical protein KDD47_08965 [Acidobacteria bacterium]|nr:hypothetical protein [Acidobacteriota bacterium]
MLHEALDVFCDYLMASGYEEGVPLYLDRQTTDVVDFLALRYLSAPSSVSLAEATESENLGAEVYRLAGSYELQPAERNPHCTWRGIADETHRSENRLRLQVSPPLENPYSTSTEVRSGVFVRFSLDGQAATWYWIAFPEAQTRSAGPLVMELDIDDG